MPMKFSKMHGAGNDYILFDCINGVINDPEGVARAVCKRRFSIGADGIVMILPSKIADARMRIFNADGSEAKMCGNASRCIGKWLFERGVVKKSRILLETESGVRELFLTVRDGVVEKITVNMGRASVGEMFSLDVAGERYEMRGVNIGNEHQVTFVPDVDFLQLERIGSAFEQNPRYEGGVNTEFCEILEKNRLKVRTFERGSGETLACGTGACASAMAGIVRGACDPSRLIRISMRGGELGVLCDSEMNLRLTGDAHLVFEGEGDI